MEPISTTSEPLNPCDNCGALTTNHKQIKLSDGSFLHIHRCDKCEDLLSRQFDWQNDNEHYQEESIICPYCDYDFGDYESCMSMEESELECPECGKKFCLEVDRTVYYSTKKRVEDMPEDWEQNLLCDEEK